MSQWDHAEIDACFRRFMDITDRAFIEGDLEPWVQCFTEDAVSDYNNGREHYEGREAIMRFLRSTLDMPVLTMHQGHQPEIAITSETTAVGRWALEDYIITLKNRGMQCAAFYRDEYVKVDGWWKIKSTGYDLVYREMWDRNETKSLKIIDRMHQPSSWEGRRHDG